jgi:hypothetical protein
VDLRAGLEDLKKRKFLTLPGLELHDPLVVQPVASRYTDYTIPAPVLVNIPMFKCCVAHLLKVFRLINIFAVQKTCGSSTNLNCTYFTNPDFPKLYTRSDRCSISVSKCNSNICQVRKKNRNLYNSVWLI